MLIYGTGGHALEILDELKELNVPKVCFFNDLDEKLDEYYGHQVLHTLPAVKEYLTDIFPFVIGIGSPNLRCAKQQEMEGFGGTPTSVISSKLDLGAYNLHLGKGLNLMSGVQISSDVRIGDGCLINRNANIHHGVRIGDFCEIAPNAILLGNVEIGHQTFIGAGAIVLPGIKIGNNCVIGAGSIVTKDFANNSIVKGNPAK